MTPQLETRYRYDAFGRRLAKEVTQAGISKTTWFGWDGDRLTRVDDEQSSRETIYEPASFVPMALLEQRHRIMHLAKTLFSRYGLFWILVLLWLLLDDFLVDAACSTIFFLIAVWCFFGLGYRGVIFLVFRQRYSVLGLAFYGFCSAILFLTAVWQLGEIRKQWVNVENFVIRDCNANGCDPKDKVKLGSLTLSDFQGTRFSVTYGVSTAVVKYHMSPSKNIEFSVTKGVGIPDYTVQLGDERPSSE